MTYSEAKSPIATGKVRVLLATIAVAVSMVFAIGAGPVSDAQATNYCWNSWLQPFGQNGDRCQSSFWGKIYLSAINTHERAGCVNYNGYYGEYYRSWACFPSNFQNGYIEVPQDGGSYHAIIRNNNLSSAGHFDGWYACCYP